MTNLTVNSVVFDDITATRSLAHSVHEEGVFSKFPFSEEKFNRLFKTTIEDPNTYLGLKVSLGKEILGFSYCILGGYYIGDGAKVVTVNTICVEKEVRSTVLGGKIAVRLVRGIKLWSEKREADSVLFHVTSGQGVAGADRFFRKMGMKTLGGNYGITLK